jgi:hypothetical protein
MPLKGIMVILAALFVHSAIGPTSSALKQVEGDIASVYKATPHRDPRINLSVPSTWNESGRWPAIVLLLGDTCLTGSLMQFATTAEYSDVRGPVATTPKERCLEDGRSAMRWHTEIELLYKAR